MEGVTVSYSTREQRWVAQYKDTHYTLSALANKYGISRSKLEYILPKPCIVSPGSQHVRLWEKSKITKLLGEK